MTDDTDLIDEKYPESVKVSNGNHFVLPYGARTGFLILEEKRKGGSRKSTFDTYCKKTALAPP